MTVAVWFFGTALLAYFALVLVFVALLLNEGSGVGSNGAHGPVEIFAHRFEPWGMIAGIAASVVAGFIVARHKDRRWARP